MTSSITNFTEEQNFKFLVMASEAQHILKRTISTLEVSREFKRMAKANGYKTLGDILNTSLNELPRRPQSGYRILKELLDILDENGLMELIKD